MAAAVSACLLHCILGTLEAIFEDSVVPLERPELALLIPRTLLAGTRLQRGCTMTRNTASDGTLLNMNGCV
jgi:hypothetical protein